MKRETIIKILDLIALLYMYLLIVLYIVGFIIIENIPIIARINFLLLSGYSLGLLIKIIKGNYNGS